MTEASLFSKRYPFWDFCWIIYRSFQYIFGRLPVLLKSYYCTGIFSWKVYFKHTEWTRISKEKNEVKFDENINLEFLAILRLRYLDRTELIIFDYLVDIFEFNNQLRSDVSCIYIKKLRPFRRPYRLPQVTF